MLKSLLQRAAHSVFHLTDASHWLAVKMLMQQEIGPIALQSTPGGDVKAFFVPYVLVGKNDCPNVHHFDSFKTTFTLDMKEPVGEGRTLSEAILDLWGKITSKQDGYSILKLEQILDASNPAHAEAMRPFIEHDFGLVSDPKCAEYRVFHFASGSFVSDGLICKEAPPVRQTDPTSLQQSAPLFGESRFPA